MTKVQCYQVSSADEVKAALETLAEVMSLDNVTQFVARPTLHKQFMAAIIQAFTQAEPYAIYEVPRLRCLALVHEVHPDRPAPPMDGPAVDEQALCEAMAQPGAGALLRLGLPPDRAHLLSAVRPDRLGALHKMEVEVDEVMRGFAKEHGTLLHLHFIATPAGFRGQGLGGVLLEHLGRVADSQGRYLYLEASTQASRRLYARHGFRDVRTFQLGEEGKDGPVFYMMLRPPASAVPAVASAL